MRKNNPTNFPFMLCKHLSHVSLLTECKQWVCIQLCPQSTHSSLKPMQYICIWLTFKSFIFPQLHIPQILWSKSCSLLQAVCCSQGLLPPLVGSVLLSLGMLLLWMPGLVTSSFTPAATRWRGDTWSLVSCKGNRLCFPTRQYFYGKSRHTRTLTCFIFT